MSNTTEIALPSEADYFKLLEEDAQSDTSSDRTASSVPEMDLVPRVFISKDNNEITIYIGDQKIWSGLKFYFLVLDTLASRTLWPPQGHEQNFPVCQLRYIDPLALLPGQDVGAGKWAVQDHFPAPAEQDSGLAAGDSCRVDCGDCPFNKYDSLKSWDTSKGSTRAKACSEDRNLFVVPMVRGAPLDAANPESEMYFWSPKPEYRFSDSVRHPFAVFDLALGSNKGAVDKIGEIAKGARKPLSSLVFCATVRQEQKPGYNFPIVDIQSVGLADIPTYIHHAKPAKTKVLEFAQRNSTAQGPVLNEEVKF